MRNAKPGDVGFAVPLLIEALDHLALELSDTDHHRAAESFFAQLFLGTDTRYSHRYVRIAMLDDMPAAVSLSYPGVLETSLSTPISVLMRERDPAADYAFQRESADDEFYLDAIAVSPAFRGRGCADRLIEDASGLARAAGFDHIGLLVDIDKPGVKRLYARHGFVVDGERMLAGHRYEHMQRRV